MNKRFKDHYAASGVDTQAESVSMRGFLDLIRETFSFTRDLPGEVLLDLGHFANVIRLGIGDKDIGLALSADGVGTKVLIAQMMGNYSTIGIDCVAMNVNDLLCVGARPISMLNYLALQKMDESMLSEIILQSCDGFR